MKYIIAFIITLSLLGCATNQSKVDPSAIVATKNVLIVPPDELLVSCKASSTPPNKLTYPTASWSDKEDMLVSYALDLISDFDKCATTVENIKKWKADNVKIFQSN